MIRRALGNSVEGVLLRHDGRCSAWTSSSASLALRAAAAPFTWYDEIARLLFVWIVFLGAAVGVKRAAHFRLHLVIDRFPAWLRRDGDASSASWP